MLPEPAGGNHWAPLEAAATLKLALQQQLEELSALDERQLKQQRYAKYRAMGRYESGSPTPESVATV